MMTNQTRPDLLSAAKALLDFLEPGVKPASSMPTPGELAASQKMDDLRAAIDHAQRAVTVRFDQPGATITVTLTSTADAARIPWGALARFGAGGEPGGIEIDWTALGKSRSDVLAEIEGATRWQPWGPRPALPSISPLVWGKPADDVCRAYGVPTASEALDALTRASTATANNVSWAHYAVEALANVLSAPNNEALRPELIQLAAVCVVWLTAIDAALPGLKAAARGETHKKGGE